MFFFLMVLPILHNFGTLSLSCLTKNFSTFSKSHPFDSFVLANTINSEQSLALLQNLQKFPHQSSISIQTSHYILHHHFTSFTNKIFHQYWCNLLWFSALSMGPLSAVHTQHRICSHSFPHTPHACSSSILFFDCWFFKSLLSNKFFKVVNFLRMLFIESLIRTKLSA